MIALLCYLWILMWNVEIDKSIFAFASTFELAIELYMIIIIFIISRGMNKR